MSATAERSTTSRPASPSSSTAVPAGPSTATVIPSTMLSLPPVVAVDGAASPAAASAVVGQAKAIVKHSSFSSCHPSDHDVLKQFKQTIVSGTHPDYTAVIKPLAQKNVSVTREEADVLWDLAWGEGQSGAEALEVVGAARRVEEEKRKVEEGRLRLEREKEDAEKRRLEDEAAEKKLRARLETAKMIIEAKEAERRKIEEESRRIKEQFRLRQLAEAEEMVRQAELPRQAHHALSLHPSPSPSSVVSMPAASSITPPSLVPSASVSAPAPAVSRGSPAPWDPKAAGANDRISMASMSKATSRLPSPLPTLPEAAARQPSPQPEPSQSQEPKRPATFDLKPDEGNKRIRLGDMVKTTPTPEPAHPPTAPEANAVPPPPSPPSTSQPAPSTMLASVPNPQEMDVDAPSTAPPAPAPLALADTASSTYVRPETTHLSTQAPVVQTALDFHCQPSHHPIIANVGSVDMQDSDADEVDALIGILDGAPSSPPPSIQPAIQPTPPEIERFTPAAPPTNSTPSQERPAPAAAREERISFASLQPSRKLLDRINLSMQAPSKKTTPAADSPNSEAAPSLSGPSLLSRITNLIPFARGAVGAAQGEHDGAHASDPLHAVPLANEATTEQSPPASPKSTHPVSLATRIEPRLEHAGLAALAEDVQAKQRAHQSPAPTSISTSAPTSIGSSFVSLLDTLPPKPTSRPPSPSLSHTSAAAEPIKQAPKPPMANEHAQPAMPQRQYSEAAKRRYEEAERSRQQREEEAKKYLQEKRRTSGGLATGSSMPAAPMAAAKKARREADPLPRGRSSDPVSPPPTGGGWSREPVPRPHWEEARPHYSQSGPPYGRGPVVREFSPPRSHARELSPVRSHASPPALYNHIASPPRGHRVRVASPQPAWTRQNSPPRRPMDSYPLPRRSISPPRNSAPFPYARVPPTELAFRPPPPLGAHRDYTRPRSPIMSHNYPPPTSAWTHHAPPPPAPYYAPGQHPLDRPPFDDRRSAYDLPPQPPSSSWERQRPSSDSYWDRAPAPLPPPPPANPYFDRRDHRGPPGPSLPPAPPRHEFDPPREWRSDLPPSARR